MKKILSYGKEIVGLSFWGGMILVGYFTIIAQKAREVEKPTYMPLRLATAEGLTIGAPVRVLGIEYGYVSSLHYMEIDEAGWPIPWGRKKTAKNESASDGDSVGGKGQCVIAILDLVDLPAFYSNNEIFTRTEQLLQPKGIDIRPGKSAGGDEITPLLLDPEERGRFVRTGQLPRRENILTAKNFDDPLFQIAVIMTENRESIRRITYNSARFTEKINNGQGTLALLLNRNDIYGGANEVLKETIFLTEDARELLESARESRQPVEFLNTFITIFFTLI